MTCSLYNANGMSWSCVELFVFWFIQGYVLVDSFFKKEELDACRDAIEVLVDGLANMLYTGNKIKSKSASEIWLTRFLIRKTRDWTM